MSEVYLVFLNDWEDYELVYISLDKEKATAIAMQFSNMLDDAERITYREELGPWLAYKYVDVVTVALDTVSEAGEKWLHGIGVIEREL